MATGAVHDVPARPRPWTRTLDSVRRALPRGEGLSDERWSARHRGIVVVLWLHVVGLPLIGLGRGHDVADAVISAGALAGLAVAASVPQFSRSARSAVTTLGLLSASAVLVHFFDGAIEAHFHFFVMVSIVALYQAWLPYLVAVTYVVLHHAVLGTLLPEEVYRDHDGTTSPWMTALVHGGFILAQSVACLVLWRASEESLEGERAARRETALARDDLEQAQQVAGMGSWDWDAVTDVHTWSSHTYVVAGQDPATYRPTVQGSIDLIHPDDQPRLNAALTHAYDTRGTFDQEMRLVRPDGEERRVHVLAEWTTSPDGSPYRLLGIMHDVTERWLLQARIEHMAFHDPLTGLANRTLFLERLEETLDVARSTGRGCAVLFIDLDEFKSVNDTYGHQAGDDALKEVATRLRAAVRPCDTVARFGGDEFAILCADVDAPVAGEVVARIRAELQRPVCVGPAEVVLGGSIGVATDCGRSAAEDVLRAADSAMYVEKSAR